MRVKSLILGLRDGVWQTPLCWWHQCGPHMVVGRPWNCGGNCWESTWHRFCFLAFGIKQAKLILTEGQQLRCSLVLLPGLQERPKCVFGGATTEGLTGTGFGSRQESLQEKPIYVYYDNWWWACPFATVQSVFSLKWE
ncbi:hypothetical protein XENTR_v10003766 [Xenopus tropicalis]|nr:hypothetical protein XENTR_v10003766 [Xenopus tropicalis]